MKQMKKSIFDGVVRKEDDHTRLLRNVMERFPEAAASVVSYLVEGSVSVVEAGSFGFRTRCSVQDRDGREIPDILIDGRDFHCLIEAKVDPARGLTHAQKNGYKGCFGTDGERHLCFLAPSRWKHSAKVDEVRASLDGWGIKVHKREWRELIHELERNSKSIGNTILIEVLTFWKGRFEVETMCHSEKEFLNTWSGEKYSAFRKLEKNIRQAEMLFVEDGEKTKADEEDYGFYIQRDGLDIIWIGIYSGLAKPLTYGFDPKWPYWREKNPLPSQNITSDDGYKLWILGEDTWDAPEKIYAAVKSFLVSQKYD